ncbi:hypothetical protein [Burkholderia arboris]|uniref:hypothetical protein n=1 Tax=Burkholderia arboris TaxID=488730 RepID=UPI00158308BB|nr:hypothetical protein [Burkholderia arboris]
MDKKVRERIEQRKVKALALDTNGRRADRWARDVPRSAIGKQKQDHIRSRRARVNIVDVQPRVISACRFVDLAARKQLIEPGVSIGLLRFLHNGIDFPLLTFKLTLDPDDYDYGPRCRFVDLKRSGLVPVICLTIAMNAEELL